LRRAALFFDTSITYTRHCSPHPARQAGGDLLILFCSRILLWPSTQVRRLSHSL